MEGRTWMVVVMEIRMVNGGGDDGDDDDGDDGNGGEDGNDIDDGAWW